MENNNLISTINTPQFINWFGDWKIRKNCSKVLDENGYPLIVYHGSPNEFNEFKSEFMGETGTALGQGFYFTAHKEEAKKYGDNIKSFYLNIRKPLNLDKLTLKPREVSLLIDKIDKAQSEADPNFRYGILSDFGDVDYEGRSRVINYATKMLMDEENDVDLIGGLINASGGYSGGFDIVVKTLRDTLGYDGIISKENNVYIAHHPNQIKEIHNINFDNNSNNFNESKKKIKKNIIKEEKGISTEVIETTNFVYKELIDNLFKIKPNVITNDCLYANAIDLILFDEPVTIEYNVFFTNEISHFNYYKEYCNGDNVYMFNSKIKSIIIFRVILINEDMSENIDILKYNIFSKEILSHELKHLFQFIKRGNKPLFNYKQGTIYKIAKEEYFKYKGSLRKTFNWVLAKIAFQLYCLTPSEITANQQKDWGYICNNFSDYDNAMSFLNSNDCEMNIHFKKSEQILKLLEKNKNNISLNNYLIDTYKRDIEWCIKTIKEGNWKCKIALMRLEKLIKQKYNKDNNDEIFIENYNKPSFLIKKNH